MRHSNSYDDWDRFLLLKSMATGFPLGNGLADSLARPFRKDFRMFVSSALGQEGDFCAELPSLKIFILRGDLSLAFNDRGECAVLENAKSGAYVVLLGERQKANFQYLNGICGFLTSEENPVQDVRALFDLWEDNIQPIKKLSKNTTELENAIKTLFRKTEFDKGYDKFLAPLFGPRSPDTAPATKAIEAKRNL